MKSIIQIILELGKVRISLPVALSALTGYVLFAGEMGIQGWLLALGVFLMSCSSATINHLQERKKDARMPRTQNRPLPSGRITVTGALVVAIVFAFSGSILLYFSNPLITLWLSWLTLIFYNLVYTPLKKITAFAVVPGSVIGALPPIIGWAGAGGDVFAEVIILVAMFFFIGQIPHFWLLLLMFGKQYQLASMPSLNQVLTEAQIKRITYTWILTTAGAAFLVVFKVFQNQILMFLLLFYIFYLLFSLTFSIFRGQELKVLPVFYRLNILYLFMMIFLIADGLLRQ